jgi:hypothetical protein
MKIREEVVRLYYMRRIITRTNQNLWRTWGGHVLTLQRVQIFTCYRKHYRSGLAWTRKGQKRGDQDVRRRQHIDPRDYTVLRWDGSKQISHLRVTLILSYQTTWRHLGMTLILSYQTTWRHVGVTPILSYQTTLRHVGVTLILSYQTTWRHVGVTLILSYQTTWRHVGVTWYLTTKLHGVM